MSDASAQSAPSRMVAFLRLEAIGDNMRMPDTRALHMALRPRLELEMRRHLLLPNRRAWCAKLTGLSEKFGFEREFLRARRDYSEANSKGSRGVYLYFTLYEGDIYEVHEIVSWSRDRRYFVKAVAGAVVEIEQAEVDARFTT